MREKIKVGIVGDTGMVGKVVEERLSRHGFADVVYRRNSKREEGKLALCDICFLATKDEESMRIAPEALGAGARVIDLSGAFRLPVESFERWYGIKHTAPELLDAAVYGMPALNAKNIAGARLVANPGCYATAVILTLSPLRKLLAGEAVVVATSGNSGARRDVEDEGNEITYSCGRVHKHVPEMNKYSGFDVDFTAVVLRSVARGINANIRVALAPELCEIAAREAEKRLGEAVDDAYAPDDRVYVVRDGEPIHMDMDKSSRRARLAALSDSRVDPNGISRRACDAGGSWGTRDVLFTNSLYIKIRVDGKYAYISSMLDNLEKGAAGQAVENMNIMTGFPRYAPGC